MLKYIGCLLVLFIFFFAYCHINTLKTIKQDDYDLLHETEQTKYFKKEDAYAGCGDCKLFAACQGELTKRPPSKSVLLKEIDDVINVFKSV